MMMMVNDGDNDDDDGDDGDDGGDVGRNKSQNPK